MSKQQTTHPDHNTNASSYVAAAPLQWDDHAPAGDFVELLGETYYRISHVDQMPTFFISVVSSKNHWLFMASNGGVTAGRTNPDSALFPYETEDKIALNREYTGGKTLLRVTRDGRWQLWEPFSQQYAGVYRCERNLYKNVIGNKLVFEEINHDLQLTLRVAWRTGERFGFVRTSWMRNDGDAPCEVELLDGLQNVLPGGATAALQNEMSVLLNAYKRNELDTETGLGIFALSATLTDRAEPSESLTATVAWQVGLDAECHLLSSTQIARFRFGHEVKEERDLRGVAGAYMVRAAISVEAGQEHQWHVVADVDQDSAAVVAWMDYLRQDAAEIMRELEADVKRGTSDLRRLVAEADGLQLSARKTVATHHFANVLFNVMRGGVFATGYQVERRDLLDFIRVRNRPVRARHAAALESLPARLEIRALYVWAAERGDPDLLRLCYEYLPLTFSRRHGDPSRPWNHFSINLKHPDGTPRLDYQGNWRDIFQNWEPQLLSYPAYTQGVIAKFLNATTVDGYNPYRVTRDGIEWEVPEPENPWSNIGYWSDHQIIYLQKLLELSEDVEPGALQAQLNHAVYSYADVPYRLLSYDEMLADWSNTIHFEEERHREIEQDVREMGTDARLLRDEAGQVVHVNMMEKLLVLLLAKVVNLVPEGGIWMNTQRPEWNDANNALVGKGLSVVTTAYLRRFIDFWQEQLAGDGPQQFAVNESVAELFKSVVRILEAHSEHLDSGFDDRARRAVMDELGAAATAYRAQVYDGGVPEARVALASSAVTAFLDVTQAYVEHTLRANRRSDDLYHAYNVLRQGDGAAGIDHLYTMLEGQVAILSSGMLEPAESAALLRSLRHSDLYRADQHTYMLYPNRELPDFRHKNRVPSDRVADSPLVAALDAAGDRRLLVRSVAGDYHFNGSFRNSGDVARVLDAMSTEPAYAKLVADERKEILAIFEETFDHRAFTGRSGTFFAYEGLGSIYWHMVSKLLLAVQECYRQAEVQQAEPDTLQALADAYYDVRDGLGYNKTPAEYGAFPTDPYSHTPAGSGARQPGMTGLVKEEILARWGELGVAIREGEICFAPTLLQREEMLPAPAAFACVDAEGAERAVQVPAGSVAFTYCQTPVIVSAAETDLIEIEYADGRRERVESDCLDAATSRRLFDRSGEIELLHVHTTAVTI